MDRPYDWAGTRFGRLTVLSNVEGGACPYKSQTVGQETNGQQQY